MTIKRSFCTALAALAFFWAGEAPGAEFRNFPAEGVCTGSRVRLREDPDTESKILGVLERDDRVSVVGVTAVEGQLWYEVERPEGTAWVFGNYIIPTSLR